MRIRGFHPTRSGKSKDKYIRNLSPALEGCPGVANRSLIMMRYDDSTSGCSSSCSNHW